MALVVETHNKSPSIWLITTQGGSQISQNPLKRHYNQSNTSYPEGATPSVAPWIFYEQIKMTQTQQEVSGMS